MWFNGGMMNGGMMGPYGVFGIITLIVHLLFWAAIFYLVFMAIKKLNVKDNHNSSSEDKSIQILKERYAKGEISEEEYKKMKDMLND